MNRVRNSWPIIFLMLIFFACGSKMRQTEENSPSSVSSSSSSSTHSHKSSHYDNMRGFDPASEDDMEDNGMSRYMENNDEEGWD